MKRFLLFFAIGFFTIGICKIGATPTDSAFYFAQGTTWTTSLRAMFGGCDDWTKTCVMQGDTLIGDDTYHNLWYDDGRRQLIIPIREDNKRIFAYLDNQDVLLYDFNLEVGDSISVCVLSGEQILCLYYTHVISTDTITLSDGRKAKRLAYDLDRLPDIEYVGCEYGIFAAIIPVRITTCGYTNSCCSLNGEPIYETSPGTCASLNPAPLVCADTWHCVNAHYDFATQKMTEFTAVTYSLQGDTIFGDTIYQTLRRGDSVYCGAIRKSADGQQVYFRPGEVGGRYARSKGKEYLLYDFSVNVGDTVYAYDGFMDTSCEQSQEPGDSITPAWKVLSIDTIDGRKHIKVEGGNQSSRIEWIEGIGTCNILFSRTMHCMTGYDSQWTLCAADSEGSILYSFDVDHLGIHNECPTWKPIDDALHSTPADNSRNRKFLHNGHIYIETPLGTFDATGRKAE